MIECDLGIEALRHKLNYHSVSKDKKILAINSLLW